MTAWDAPLRSQAFLFFCCFLLTSCHSLNRAQNTLIEFTTVPPSSLGGPDKLDVIEGRVNGARPGQQIVLYSRSGVWWVQPFADHALTPIGPDSKWSSPTHLGTEYAALLVEPGFSPSAKLQSLPAQGGSVVLVAIVQGKQAPPELSKTIQFSGYEWNVRATASERGGRVSSYDPSNAWTDPAGVLHLRIANKAGKWTCAEVSLARSLGYGSYRIVVRETSQLEPSVVLSMFTWDDLGVDPNHRELDVEISRWGDPHSKNAQYVVQPYYVPANVARFSAPSGPLSLSFRWEPGKASFRSNQSAGAAKQGRLIAEHVFTSGVPLPGSELVHLNLYIFGNAQDPIRNQTEVVIDKFEYLP